ncbi:MAG: hypothetical protein AAB116_04560 [Candidatus Poribacteria bacterium]
MGKSFLFIFLIVCAFKPAVSGASNSPTPSSEITVNLFGQPCLLTGPLDKETLKIIHSISPEQLYPHEPEYASTMQALKKLRAVKSLPPSLDRYKDRLAKRLEAQLSFFEGLATAKKPGKIPFLNAVKPHIKGNSSAFTSAVNKLVFSEASNNQEKLDTVFELYNEIIEPDPEEDFHRAIKKLNVQYTCVFEDSSDDKGM